MPTESQLRDPALRTRIHRRIEERRLPVMVPKRISAGYGTGSRCDACDQPITLSQVEYDIDDVPYGAPLSLHLGCHVLWQIECVKRMRGAMPAER
jgi:hypothetical protein